MINKKINRCVTLLALLLSVGQIASAGTDLDAWYADLFKQYDMVSLSSGVRVSAAEKKAVWTAFRKQFGDVRVQMGRTTCVATNDEGRCFCQNFTLGGGLKGIAVVVNFGQQYKIAAYSMSGYAAASAVSMQSADEFVFAKIIGEDNVQSTVWGAESILSRNAEITLGMSGAKIELPYECAYAYFIDDMPNANWGHPARIVFIKEDLSSYIVYNVDEPVAMRIDGRDVRILKDTDAKVKVHACNALAASGNAPSNGTGSDYVALTDGLPENCYALIVSGGVDQYNNHIRYWNDMTFAYNVLSKRYAIPKGNIKVLWASGDPDADICWNSSALCNDQCKRRYSFNANDLEDLDGDGESDIDGAATRSNVQNALSWYRQNLKSTDQLFIFVTDHGGTYNSASVEHPATLCLWGWATSSEPNGLKDTELASMTAGISCPVVIAMETCYSGGFCSEIVASAQNRLILTADGYHSSLAGGTGMDMWVYNFFSALGGYYPDQSSAAINVRKTGVACNADQDGDGRISFAEAHAFAVENNPFTVAAGYEAKYVDEPQCQPSNLAAKYFLVKYADQDPVAERVAAPTLSPAADACKFAPYAVTASCGTAGATIRYTLDGSEPTYDSTCYKGGIAITRGCTVKVRAFKSEMDASETVSVAYTVRKTAPEKATIMSVSQADSSTAIVVKWLSGEGADSFDLLRSEYESMASASVVANGLFSGTSIYADATVKRGKTYYYQVRSCNAYGKTLSDASFGAGLALNPPSNVKATVKAIKAKTASIEVSWTASECASHYRVYRCGTDGKTIAVSSWIAETKYVDDTVPVMGASTSYAYYVESAMDSSGHGESPMSEDATVEVSPSTDGWSLLLSYVWWSSSECGDRAIKPGSYDNLCVRLKYADGSIAQCSECTHIAWAVVEGEGITLTPEDGSAWLERPPEVRIDVDQDAPEQIARLRATFAPATGDQITRDVLLYISEDGILQSLGISSYEYLVPGESMQLTPIGVCYANANSRKIDENAEVTWSIIDGTGAIIDEDGVLTALTGAKDTRVVVQASLETARGVVTGTRTVAIRNVTITKQTVEIEPLGGEEIRYIPRDCDGQSSYKAVQYQTTPTDWLSGIGFQSGSSPESPNTGIVINLGGKGSGNIGISGYMFIVFTAARNPGKDREMLFKLRWDDGGTDYTIRQKEAPYADNPDVEVSNGLSASEQRDGSIVRYATDGEEPSENSPVLDGTVTFKRNTPVAVKAFGEWMQESDTFYGDVEGGEQVGTVNITFDPIESGVAAPSVRIYKVSDTFGELPTLKKSGMFFHGWTLYRDSSKRISESDYVPSADAVLYARWSEIPEDEPEWAALPWNFQSSMTGYVKVFDQTTQSWLDTAIVGVEDEDGECRGSSKNGFGDWQDERNGVDGLCVFGIYGNVETGDESGLEFRVWIPGKGYAAVINGDVAYMADSALGTETDPFVLNVMSTIVTTEVSFNANGGIGAGAAVTATNGIAMPAITTTPTKCGYEFTGYYDGKTGGTKYYDADLTSARNWDMEDAAKTLYAQYEPVVYTITYLNLMGSQNPNPETYTVEDEIVFEDLADTDGYRFIGWSPDSVKRGTIGEIEVLAHWRVPGSVDVKFDYKGAEGYGDYVQGMMQGETFGALPVPEWYGYVFEGWYTSAGKQVTESTVVPDVESVTLVAKWRKVKTYKLTIKGYGAEASSGDNTDTKLDVMAGQEVCLSAPDEDNKGKIFQKWAPSKLMDLGISFKPGETDASFVMPEEAVTLTATYIDSSKAARVTGVAAESGQCVWACYHRAPTEMFQWSPDGKTWYASGDEALVAAGRVTVQWRSLSDNWQAPSTKTTVTLKAGDDETVQSGVFTYVQIAAVCSAVYAGGKLDYDANGGTASTTPTDGRILSGKTVTLTAKAAKNYVFAGWMLDADWEQYGSLVFENCQATAKLASLGSSGDADGKVHYTAVFRAKSSYTDADMDGAFRMVSDDMGNQYEVTGNAVTLESKIGCWTYFDVLSGCDALTYPLTFKSKGTLPRGLKFDAKTGTIYGTPTAVAASTFTITALDCNGHSRTLAVTIDVQALPDSLVGNYRALMYDTQFDTETSEVISTTVGGILEMSVTDKGKVSAKVTMPTGTTSFAPTLMWSRCYEEDEEGDGAYGDEFSICYYKSTGSSSNGSECSFEFNTENGEAYYSSESWNTKSQTSLFLMGSARTVPASANFNALKDTYYTMRLQATEPLDMEYEEAACRFPLELCANGYLTLTIDKKGAVKYAGVLPDGEKLTGSAILMPHGDDEDGEMEGKADVIVFAVPSGYRKQGLVAFTLTIDASDSDAGVTVCTEDGGTWRMPALLTEPADYCSSIGDRFDAEVFLPGYLQLEASGSKYSTLDDLTKYFMSASVDAADEDSLAYEYTTSYTEDGKKYTENNLGYATLEFGSPVITGDKRGKVTVAKSGTPWKDTDGEYHYDTDKSNNDMTNPSGLTLSYVPKTGIFSGKYNIFFDYWTTSGTKETLNHKSVSISYLGAVVRDEYGIQGYGVGVYSGKYNFLYSTTKGRESKKSFTKKTAMNIDWTFDEKGDD